METAMQAAGVVVFLLFLAFLCGGDDFILKLFAARREAKLQRDHKQQQHELAMEKERTRQQELRVREAEAWAAHDTILEPKKPDTND